MRPTNKTWSLTVRRGSLELDGPLGRVRVRGLAPEVVPVIGALPDGIEVECEGAFDGGETVMHLVVTKVRRILKDLSGRVMQLPDAVVAADPRLAAARAHAHLAAGRIAAAARDIGALLDLGDDQALGELEKLPLEHQQALVDQLVAWQAPRKATWRALKHISMERWTDANVEQAVEQALVSGGVFGAAPGIRVEALLDELARRRLPVKTLAKQTQRLRRAQATEGDTFWRLVTELAQPRVIGADDAGVYVAGAAKADGTPTVVHHALDGRELRRWAGLRADRVVAGVALQIEADEPAGVRLSDGKTLYTFAHRIEHHDGELVWGVHRRDPATHTMRSEIRHIATGYTIAKLDGWVDEVTWDAQHIYVHGAAPQTLTREGRLVRASVPPPPAMLEIETATGHHAIPAEHAPWLFGDFTSTDAGGWIAHAGGRALYLAPSEPGATWVHVELAEAPARVDLAPPWLALHDRTGGPILLVALAEAMSAVEIRVDGKRVLRRAKADPRLVVPAAVVAWYEQLVAAGVAPALPAAARDAHLHRTLGHHKKRLPDHALASVLVGHAPVCIDHADLFVEADDALFARLDAVFAPDGVRVRELERRATETEDDDGSVALTIEVSYAGKTIKRPCGWAITRVMPALDAMLAQLGAPRRLFAITSDRPHRRVYLAITPAQRGALAAAGVEGIRASARD